MPPAGPIKRKDLIYDLRRLGFSGPFAGGKHEFMLRDRCRLPLPNPHHGDINKPLLIAILREAGVTLSEWEAL